MKKLYNTFLAAVCLMLSLPGSAQTVVFDFAANPWNLPLGSGSGASAAVGDVTEIITASGQNENPGEEFVVNLTCEQGTAQQPVRMWTGPQLRAYAGNTLTLKPADGSKAIVSVTFAPAGSSNYGLTTTAGTLDGFTWTGNHTEVTFSPTKTNRLNKITVELADANAETVKPGAYVQMPNITPRNNTNRTDSVVVTIAGDSATKIFYTIDGSSPTNASLPYTAPFTLYESATVKAIAYDTEGNFSSVAEIEYTITKSLPTDTTATDTTATDTTVIENYEIVTFPFSQNPWNLETGSEENSTGGAVNEPITKDDVVFSTNNGVASTSVRMWNTNGNVTLRTYNNTAITLAVADASKAIYRIVLEGNGMNFTCETGEINTGTKTWTGNATGVTLLGNKSTQIKSIAVYLGQRTDATVIPAVYVATPAISPNSGEKKDSIVVNIKFGEGTQVYYTIDGSEPNQTALQYQGPFTLHETATVKAIAYDANGNASAVTEATYTIAADPTGIDTLSATTDNPSSTLYDLQGRRLANPTNGIYIRNGRKVYIK